MSEAQWILSLTEEHEATNIQRRQANVDHLLAGAALTCLAATLASPLIAPWMFVDNSNRSLFVAVCLTLLLGTTNGVHIRNAHRDLANATDIAMRAEFGGGVGWLVEVVILQGDALTGVDRGMLWFDERRLLFAGPRTSFALASRQAYAVLGGEGRRGRGDGSWTVRLKGGRSNGPLSVRIRPFVGPYPRGKLGNWLTARFRDAIEAPEGNLPPQRLGPGAPSPARLLARAVLSSLYWGAFAFLMADALILSGYLLGATLCVGPPLFGVWRLVAWVARIESVIDAWSAYRDRRRVA